MTIKSQKSARFHFKQFSIEQGQAGMAVSTDGVILGAWANINQAQHILDIGTGTGLLALMCAQRQPNANITAIDIEPHAVAAAQHNVAQSPWHSRVTVMAGDILTHHLNRRFDAIICNPPYFNDGASSAQPQRATARHTQTLSHTDLLMRCSHLLQPEGRASFILPVTEGEQFIQQAQQLDWTVSRLCRVQPTSHKPVHRLLIELTRDAQPCQQSTLIIREQQDYHPQFITLTRDFYLKMA